MINYMLDYISGGFVHQVICRRAMEHFGLDFTDPMWWPEQAISMAQIIIDNVLYEGKLLQG